MAATAPRPRSGSRPSEHEDAPRRFLARRVPSGLAPEQAVVHDRLVAAATERPAGEARRRPFVALDGTPLVYSATSTGGFRMLAEPGALDRDVPAQVDFALTVLDELLGELEWRGAADDVNAVVRAAMPRRAPEARLLRGGAALGLACGPRFELRLYLDLRGADVLLRWQRVADVLGQFGGPAAERSFVRLLARAERTAVPVGLAAVLADGALRGLRLYVGVEHASASTLTLATALPASLLGPFCRLLGPFGRSASPPRSISRSSTAGCSRRSGGRRSTPAGSGSPARRARRALSPRPTGSTRSHCAHFWTISTRASAARRSSTSEQACAAARRR